MDEEVLEVSGWLLHASAEVPSDYFQLPVAGAEEPEYRERVYCYELYHRWRSRWPHEHKFSLCGEVDKNNHPIVRGALKPDFLVHVPGRMDNLLVVEVKPSIVSHERVREDIDKLLYFRIGGPGYRAAFLWIYGMSNQGWLEFRQGLRIEDWGAGIVENHVHCLLHSAAGAQASFAAWR